MRAASVLYVSRADVLPENRNYNRLQRLLLAPPEARVRLLLDRGARVEVALPANVQVLRASLPGLLGYCLSEVALLIRARSLGIDAVATMGAVEGVPTWACRPLGRYRWVCDIWDTPHKHLVTYYAEARTPSARLRRAAARLKVALFRRILRSADLVIASACARGLDEYRIPASRLAAYTNAVALDELRPGAEDRRPNSLCFVSSVFLRDRGLDTLAAAVKSLSEEGVEVLVRVVGDVPADVEAELQAHPARECFELLGGLSIDEAHEVMRRSEIGLVPFHDNEDLAHTQPVKLFEYMALGCVIVASDLPGLRTIVRDGRDGLLVCPGDAAALANAVSRLLSDDVLRARLRATASERVKDFDARAKVRSIYADIDRVCFA